MQVQFPKKAVTSLRCILSQAQSAEESQQLRIPEPMADIDRILGAWGQILVRGKEWREDYISVSGGTMVWVMYLPEGESQAPQMVQAWLPFQMKWDIPHTKVDGKIRILPLLESVDARSTSARKMVVRASVNILAEAYTEEECDAFLPEDLPEDVCVLKKTYPLLLTRECGEKIFEMEEDLTLPQSAPPIAEILRFSFHPELIDQKVLSGKVVFRGSGLAHILYRSEEGELCTWDFEIPFAQYDTLETEYEQDARCRVLPVVTALELEHRPGGELRLKAGICGQYMICDFTHLTFAADAYCIHGETSVQQEVLDIPAVLEIKQHTIPVEMNMPITASRVIDTSFYPGYSKIINQTDIAAVDITGTFCVLYQDENGHLQGKTQRWQGECKYPAATNVQLSCHLQPSGIPRTGTASADTLIKSNLYLDALFSTENRIPMVAGVEVGEKKTPDPNRPCLIMQKMGNTSLWELAKKNGSTVEKIRSANHLEEAAQPGQILLIPVL